MESWTNFYRGKRVFLTGHTGFKGSWLALWLLELGAQVHGYSLPAPTKINLFDEAKLADRLSSHEIGDVRDHQRLYQSIAKIKPEIVFHLAAQSLVRRSYAEPRQTYETNVMGTVNLLEAVRRVPGVRVCQVITSDKCYENHEDNHPCREGDPMGGSDPYSSSKGCAELVVAAYRRSFFSAGHEISLASARAGNVIGGGDWAEDRIMPDCIRALERNEPIMVRHPDAVRPWQHVLEPLSGYLQLAARQWNQPAAFADGWNFGPAATGHLKVSQIVDKTIRVWGGGSWKASPKPDAQHSIPHEAGYLQLDITKAVAHLGWQPRLNVDQAVEQTVMWYRQRAAAGTSFDAHEITLRQIRSYMAGSSESQTTGAATSMIAG